MNVVDDSNEGQGSVSKYDVLGQPSQRNSWLRRDGKACRKDLEVETNLYEFESCEDLETLRLRFAERGFELGQGILYRDLAFIQQKDLGDEWRTFKYLGNEEWLPFENWSFRLICQDPRTFNNAIVSMEMATPRECRNLDYMLPETDLVWRSEIGASDVQAAHSAPTLTYTGESDFYRVVVNKSSDISVCLAQLYTKDVDGSTLVEEFREGTALASAMRCCERVGFAEERRHRDGIASELVAQRAARAMEGVRAMNSSREVRDRVSHTQSRSWSI